MENSMAVRRAAVVVTQALLVIWLGGCGDPTAPADSSSASLSLETIGNESGGSKIARAVGRVLNTGNTELYYPIHCGYVIGISVTDDRGAYLLVSDPGLVPVCPPGFSNLMPGDSVESSVQLEWAWDSGGEKHRIPSGQYTLSASFVYYIGADDDEPVRVTTTMVTVID
jgi:hypothetical protein